MPFPRRRTPQQVEADAARWVAARRAGLTVAQVAAEAGTSPAVVSRATSPSGPFPVLHRVTDQEGIDWAALRRDAVTPAQIAAQAGVTAATVVKATAALGPFPPTPPPPPRWRPRWSRRDADRWTALRHQRVPMTRIAHDANTANAAITENSDNTAITERTCDAEQTGPGQSPARTPPHLEPVLEVVLEVVLEAGGTVQAHSPTTSPSEAPSEAFAVSAGDTVSGPATTVAPVGWVTPEMVRAATRLGGPFPTPLVGPPGLVGIRRVAEMARLSQPTIAHRVARGQLPPPRLVTASGKPKWDPDDITAWLKALDLPQCLVCGAKARRLDLHQQIRHPATPGTAP